jgi:hypothetical protein
MISATLPKIGLFVNYAMGFHLLHFFLFHGILSTVFCASGAVRAAAAAAIKFQRRADVTYLPLCNIDAHSLADAAPQAGFEAAAAPGAGRQTLKAWRTGRPNSGRRNNKTRT